MIKRILFLAAIVIMFNACDSNYAYSVYVQNKTGEDLTIKYKAKMSATEAMIEKTIILAANESKTIIPPVEIEAAYGDPSDGIAHCNLIAEYITAYNEANQASSLKWCSDKVKYNISDIQEGEFTMTYTADDF